MNHRRRLVPEVGTRLQQIGCCGNLRPMQAQHIWRFTLEHGSPAQADQLTLSKPGSKLGSRPTLVLPLPGCDDSHALHCWVPDVRPFTIHRANLRSCSPASAIPIEGSPCCRRLVPGPKPWAPGRALADGGSAR